MHRVTLPPTRPPPGSNATSAPPKAGAEKPIKSRYSIPYFVAPDNDAIVRCLASCVTDERPERYEPVKFADYGEYLSKYMYQSGKGKGPEGFEVVGKKS